MLRSALVGLDGSPYSTAAVNLALEWGKRFKAQLVGLGIIDEPGVREAEAMPIGASAYKEHADAVKLIKLQKKVDRFLEKFAAQCKEAKVRHKLIEETGVPYEEILEECQRHDLIILGQQTYFEYDEAERAGTTVQEVLKNSPRPVVTVPKRLRAGDAVVIAFDGSLQASHALQLFTHLELYRDKNVHLVCIKGEEDVAKRTAARGADFLIHHRLKPTVHALASGDPIAEVLLNIATDVKAQIMVMGAYGESSLREFFFGSVTRTILKKATLPLFLYH